MLPQNNWTELFSNLPSNEEGYRNAAFSSTLEAETVGLNGKQPPYQ
jgi:hypothetical protein